MMLPSADVPVRVRYGETDQMGIVYHANYVQYYEIARTELIRGLGMSYREMEERGILLVVREVRMTYLAPAYYDEILNVRVSLRREPTATVVFDFEVFNPAGELINRGEVTLVSVDRQSRKPVRCPRWFLDLMHGGR